MYKPIKFLFFSMAFLGLFLTSCQKEKPSKMKTTISRAEAEKMVKEQRHRDVKRIRHFVDKMNDVMSSSAVAGREEPLTIDEMTFGTEAVLNIYYTSPSNRFTEVDQKQEEVTIPITNGVVADADLVAAYTSVGQKMMDHLDAVNYPNKKVVYVDVVLTNTTATEATLEVKTAVGDRRLDPSPTPPYFVKGWRCGDGVYNDLDSNQTGDLNYLDRDKDAAKLFASTLNEHYRLDHPFPQVIGVCYYSYGVTQATADYLFYQNYPKINPNDPAAGTDPVFDNSKDYLFYKISKSANSSNYDDKKYLNMDEMNFYYSGLEQTIQETEDPAWQAANAAYFPPNVSTDSESWFYGWTFLSMPSNIAQETQHGLPNAETRHIPKVEYQQTIGMICIPDNPGGGLLDELAILTDFDWP